MHKIVCIEIQLTLRCNYDCIMCNHRENMTDVNQVIPLKDALRCIREAKEMGARIVALIGGEPFTYPWINEVLDEIKKEGLSVMFFTNAELINENILNRLEGVEQEYVISLHSATKELNDSIRGTESNFEKIVDNIKIIKKRGHKVKIASVLMEENVSDIKKLSSLLYSIGIDEKDIEIFPLDYMMCPENYKSGQDFVDVMKKYFEDYLSGKISEEESIFAMSRGFYYYILDKDSIKNKERGKVFKIDKMQVNCPQTESSVFIDTQGNVLGCCHHYDSIRFCGVPPLGNIKEESLKNIMEGERALNFREDTVPIKKDSEIYNKICINCDDLPHYIMATLNKLKGRKVEEVFDSSSLITEREIFVNNICNNNCKECRNDLIDPKNIKNHSKEFLLKLIQENIDLGVKKIIIKGKEPTLHPDLKDIIEFMKKKDIEVELDTNGRMFFYDNYAKKIGFSGVDKIKIFMKSKDQKEHDNITQVKDSFVQSIKGIDNIRKYHGNVGIIFEDEPVLPLLHGQSFEKDRYVRYFESIKNEGFVPEDIMPYEIDFHITYKCNLSCKMCFNPEWNKCEAYEEEPLSTKRIKELIDEFESIGVKSITLTGGEPLIRKDIKEIIEYASSKKGLKKSIQTNGTLMTQEIADILCKEGWYVVFSFDGSCSDIHDKIRGKGSFDSAIAGFNKLLKAKESFGIGGLRTHMVLQKENITDIFAYADFFGSKGADLSCDFMGEVHEGRFDEKSFDKYIKFINEIEKNESAINNKHFRKIWNYHKRWSDAIKKGELKKEDLINGRISPRLIGRGEFYCLNCDQALITAYGDVYPCCSWFILKDHKDKSNSAGNVLNLSFSEVWQSEKFNSIRKKLMPIDSTKEPCKTLCADCEMYFYLKDMQDKVIDIKNDIKK